MDKKLPTIVMTSGEPGGVGPDICLKLMHNERFSQALQTEANIEVWGCPTVFSDRAKLLGLSTIDDVYQPWHFQPLPMPPVVLGEAKAEHAPFVLQMIDQAVEGCFQNRYAGMVFAPIQKASIIDAGYCNFQGQTEYLAELCGNHFKKNNPQLKVPQSLMMLTEVYCADHSRLMDSDQKPLRVCLATTHVPLAQVPELIQDQEHLLGSAEILARDLRLRYGILRPRIAVLALNPHAGEEGKIGTEEIKLIAPFIEECRARFPEVDWEGPISADAAFIPKLRSCYDAYLGMYHDQVLPVFKALAFGGGVNVTLGLPFIRTSVDHGTALSLAGSGEASEEGLKSALMECLHLISKKH